MEKKYLGYQGLQDVAGHVNTRLKTVTTIPASADDGAVRLYVGETGVTYKKGHIYQYNATDLEWVDITSSSEYTAGNGIDITDNEISVETYIFTGTQAQWDALTTEQKKEYDICNITDDASSDDEIYTKSEIDAMLGTAASKDATDVVRPNDHDLVESNAVYAAINNALSSIYTPRGDLTCAELTSALLIEQNVGNVYQMTDSGTTSALFINGAGHTINVNDNVGIIKAGQDTYLFNLMGNAFDLHDYQKKDLTTPLTIGGTSRTTVEGALGALNDVDTTKMSYADNGILGAKNLLPLTLASLRANTSGGTWTNNVYVKEGITYTVYTNSNGFVTRINANGTTSTNPSNLIFNHNSRKNLFLSAGTYIISKGNTNNSAILYWNLYNDSTYVRQIASLGSSASQEVIIDYSDYNAYEIGIHVVANSTINVDFYPMIRYAFDVDNTYQSFAMTNQQMTPYVQAISNPNLLDNPWFTVNQRGFTTNTANGYTVDRWKKQAGDGTITKSSDGITIEPTTSGSMLLFRQQLDTNTMIPYILGKTVTLSVMLSNGTIYSATGTAPITLTSSFQYLCYVQIDSVNRFVLQLKNGDCSVQYYNDGSIIPSTIITVKAIKLELGSVSTLAMDTAPNTATELLKCQRYFVRYTGAGYPEICHAIESSGLNAWGLCFLPVPMRIKPSIAFANVNAYRLSDDSATAITAMEIHALANNACKIMFTLASNGINGSVAEIQPNSANNGYVDFSADL